MTVVRNGGTLTVPTFNNFESFLTVQGGSVATSGFIDEH